MYNTICKSIKLAQEWLPPVTSLQSARQNRPLYGKDPLRKHGPGEPPAWAISVHYDLVVLAKAKCGPELCQIAIKLLGHRNERMDV